MASSDFSVPQELNPGVDRSPAAPAVSRRIYIPPSNGTEFNQNGDLQFRLPTAEPGSILDAKYTYMKFTVVVEFEPNDIPNPPSAAIDINSVWRWPASGGNSLFERLEVYQGGTPIEQISHYNIIAKKYFQQEAGSIGLPGWYPGFFVANKNNPDKTWGTVPTTQYEEATGAHRTFEVVTQRFLDDPVLPTVLKKTFTFCIPILSGLVGLWSEKYLPLMLLGVSSLFLNFKLTDLQSFLEPIWSSQTDDRDRPWGNAVPPVPPATVPSVHSDVTIGMDVNTESIVNELITANGMISNGGNKGFPNKFTLQNVELVCTQILLLPSVTQLVYANANQNSISWTTTSRRDYPQIMAGESGGWTNQQTPSPAVSTSYDLIIPCRLQSVRNFDIIMTYIGSVAFAGTIGAFTNWWHPWDHQCFLNPIYQSLQYKKGSDFFPQRPMTQQNSGLTSWPTGCGSEFTSEQMISDGSWEPYNEKSGFGFMKDERWVASGVSPFFKQMGTYSISQDCRTFRGVDASTRSGISFEKEQFNVAFSIIPMGGNAADNTHNASLKMPMNYFRFHFIPVYDMMVTITPTGSMEVAF